jgi:hypothetical protein
MSEALTPYRPPRFIAGLDCGQLSDPSALILLERSMRLQYGQLEPYYFAGHLERLPLQTPYPAMVRGVRQRLERVGERCVLVIDATGVGRGVVDLFREGWATYDPLTMERRTLPGKPTIVALTLTGGEVHRAERWDEQSVPRRDVILRFMLALQQQRFQGAASLPELPTLIQEAKAFQWKKSPKGDDYSAWSTGKHDDLLFATAIAVWYGDTYSVRTVPGQGTQYAAGNTNLLSRGARWRRP